MPPASTSVHFQLAHVLTERVPGLVECRGLTAEHQGTPGQKQVFSTDYAATITLKHTKRDETRYTYISSPDNLQAHHPQVINIIEPGEIDSGL
jgi:hypothetical protein